MPDREKVIKDLEEYRDREFVKEGITVFDNDPRYRKLIIGYALTLLKEQPEIVRCKDCKKRYTVLCIQEEAGNINNQDDWFCADGIAKDTDVPNK